VALKRGHLVFLPAALALPRPRHSTANMQIIPFSSHKLYPTLHYQHNLCPYQNGCLPNLPPLSLSSGKCYIKNEIEGIEEGKKEEKKSYFVSMLLTLITRQFKIVVSLIKT